MRLLILSGLGGVFLAINCWAKEGGRGEAINSFSPWGRGGGGKSQNYYFSFFCFRASREMKPQNLKIFSALRAKQNLPS